MQVFRSLEEIPADFGPTVISVGNYDGLHCAHRMILNAVVRRAKELNARSVLVTFEPHPLRILKPGAAPPLITPPHRKLELLSEVGLDAIVIVPFGRDLSMMPPFEFAEEIISTRLHAIEVHEGFNFRFGHNAEGDMDRLKEFGKKLGFDVVLHQPLKRRGQKVSSSNVRKAVAAGKLSEVRALLGRHFSIDSTPGRGRGYGTKYAVPTVNLNRYNELIPANGVYVTEIEINGELFRSVTNIGNRPTFGADSFAIESYILNFHPIDLSSETPLRLTFLKRLRDERKFPSPEELKAQIGRDVRRAERYFHLRDWLTSKRSTNPAP